MKILIDMNLSPDWVREFNINNINAIHWSSVGKFDAPDSELMNWARENDHVVFTHDLDLVPLSPLLMQKSPALCRYALKTLP